MPDITAIDKYAGRLLMVSFFLPQRWQVFAVMAGCGYLVCRSVAGKERIEKSNLAAALLLGSMYLLYLFAFPLTPTEHRKFLLTLYERKASLLAIPIVFSILSHAFRKVIADELQYFAYACFLSSLAANCYLMYSYLLHKSALNGLSHVAYRLGFEDFTGIHPTYMGMFFAFSICITLMSQAFNFRYGGKVKYALVYFLLLFLLSLLAKSALIAMGLIFIHYAYINRKAIYQYRLRIGIMTATLVAMCFFIPFIGQRVKEVFSFMGVGKPGNATDNSVYVRKLILDEDTRLLKENWLTGVGPAKVNYLLNQRYFFYSLNHNFNISRYDPHNEYLSEWLSFGIAGILLFATILVIHFRKAILLRNHLYIYCLIILCVTFLTETVLARQEGVLFYAIFTSLFFFGPKRNTITA
jgi:O-antigen ligase